MWSMQVKHLRTTYITVGLRIYSVVFYVFYMYIVLPWSILRNCLLEIVQCLILRIRTQCHELHTCL